MRFRSHKKRLKNVRGSEDTFKPAWLLSSPRGSAALSLPDVRSFSPLTKSIRFIISPRPLGLRCKTRLLVFNCFMHSQVRMSSFFFFFLDANFCCRRRFLLDLLTANYSPSEVLNLWQLLCAHTVWVQIFSHDLITIRGNCSQSSLSSYFYLILSIFYFFFTENWLPYLIVVFFFPVCSYLCGETVININNVERWDGTVWFIANKTQYNGIIGGI